MSALLFLRAAFRPNHKALIIAQGDVAAKDIFKRVIKFWECLPSEIRPEAHLTKTSIEFVHGFSISIITCNSKSIRSGTYNDILGTEVAFWDNPEETWKAARAMVSGGNGIVVCESTPKRLNFFYNLFSNNDHGLRKFFSPWMDEPTYVRPSLEYPVTDKLREYAEKYELSDEQLNWAAETLSLGALNDWSTFLQEYAPDPEACFLSSGDAVFDCPKGWESALDADKDGFIYFEQPSSGPYSLGVDSATGSQDGDYSTGVVINWANPIKPTMAATYMGRDIPHVFGAKMTTLALKYNAAACVESNGGYGDDVINSMIAAGVTQWRDAKLTPNGPKFAPKFGFSTTSSTRPRLWALVQQYYATGKLDIKCPRLRKQMAQAVYLNGRPDHPPGKHDDLILALAFSLMAKQLAQGHGAGTKHTMPTTHEDMAKYERRTGKSFNALVERGDFEYPSGWVDDDSAGYEGW